MKTLFFVAVAALVVVNTYSRAFEDDEFLNYDDFNSIVLTQVRGKGGREGSTICSNWPPQGDRCNAGELYGQVPGNSFQQKCFEDPRNKRSMTTQRPIREFKEFGTLSSKKRAKNGDILVQVFTLPIGQGDCNIIKCNEGKNVIIFDCGSIGRNHLKSQRKYASFIPNILSGAEFATIIISHAHRDHYNMIQSLVSILGEKIQYTIVGGETSDYPESIKRISVQVAGRSGAKTRGYFCSSPQTVFDLVQGNIRSNRMNERGLLMKLSCRTCKSSLLMAADMEGHSARIFATSRCYSDFLQSTHYKMAHHGASDEANFMEWLEAIRPVEVHVSHMYNHGSFHHPRCVAFNRLMAVGSVGMASGAPAAKPHDLACFGEKDEGYRAYDQCVYHRIFSTAPRKNKICWIVLTFKAGQEAVTNYYCGDV